MEWEGENGGEGGGRNIDMGWCKKKGQRGRLNKVELTD